MKRNSTKGRTKSNRKVKPLTGERRCSAIRAALALRRPGASHEDAADAAGMSSRNLRHWRAQDWWSEIEAEASGQETEELVRIAVESLRANMPEDGKLSLRVLERLDPRFAPATQRHEVQVGGFRINLVDGE